MLFNTPAFFIFFAIVFLLYLLFSHRWQNLLLLVAGYFFYGYWDYRFTALLFLSSAIDFCFGIWIFEAPEVRKKVLLTIALSLNLLILGFFKYFMFIAIAAQKALGLLHYHAELPFLEIILPVGISFYTFQSMAYSLEIYRGNLRPERNILEYSAYVSFFPQLVAGPIERPQELLSQVQAPRTILLQNVMNGLCLMALGYLKKVAVADNLALYVDSSFSHIASSSPGKILVALCFFSIQIYFDFSGYTDIARGIAKTLGFELVQNFRQPYFATNPVDFWERWHISLSSWFRDYLYYPLAMHYMRKTKGYFNKYKPHLITMALIGLWHGANLKFVVFGIYWGICIIGYNKWKKQLSSVPNWVAYIFMYLVICFGWALFRLDHLSDLKYLFINARGPLSCDDIKKQEIEITLLLAASVAILDYCFEFFPNIRGSFKSLNHTWLKASLVIFLGVITVFCRSRGAISFIYFQF